MKYAQLQFEFAGKALAFTPTRLMIGGWAGRDQQAIQAHTDELAEMGIAPPKKTPCFYELEPLLLTTATKMAVPRADSSGEVEVVFFKREGELYLGVASDHTDRKVEAYDITVSKQMCMKPMSTEVWKYSDIADHWDELMMRCYRTLNGERALYQEGSVTSLLHPLDLMEKWKGKQDLDEGEALLCGTQAVIGQLGFGEKFELELVDPVLNRTLRHQYDVAVLTVDE